MRHNEPRRIDHSRSYDLPVNTSTTLTVIHEFDGDGCHRLRVDREGGPTGVWTSYQNIAAIAVHGDFPGENLRIEGLTAYFGLGETVREVRDLRWKDED